MIETSRLMLTEPSLADFDDTYAMTSDPAVMTFISSKPANREDAWNKLLRNIGHWKSLGFGIFTVREKQNHTFIGAVGLAHFARGLGDSFDPFPEASWILASKSHGRGYATEAVSAALDWMNRTHRPTRTVCIIHPNNEASRRVATKLGYVKFGEAQYRDASPGMFERAAVPA